MISTAMPESHVARLARSGETKFVSIREHELVVNTWTRDNAVLRRGLGSAEDCPDLTRPSQMTAQVYTLEQALNAQWLNFVSLTLHMRAVTPLREENEKLRRAVLSMNPAY